ncbi:MAG: aminotransferase class I/II-fold pyridoxal phosphate-dependent enzyme [Erysipelotrichaceae bacterium]|nr:aminotransferase class I/II-fold pyridoxal phosphate-dependent enzyme [Erysipelotrichaceae bacterium]
MKSQEDIRSELEIIDSMISELLKKRMDVVKSAGSEPLYSRARESYIINKVLPDTDNEYYPYYYRMQNLLFDLTEQMQNRLANRSDRFLRDNNELDGFSDAIFALSHQASTDLNQNPDKVINSTVGALRDESHELVAFRSVYDIYNAIPDSRKAAYAGGIAGSDEYRRAVYDFINRTGDLQMPHEVIATAGGTGALALGFSCFTQDNDYVLLPSPGWGNYRTMAKHGNLNVESYTLVNEKGEVDLTDLMTKGIYVMKKCHKLIMVVNDPCQNPTGISLSDGDWDKLTAYLNKMATFGSVVLMLDLAYMDYANDGGRRFLKHLNSLSSGVMTMLAFSCSKSVTAYGMRLGAAVLLNGNQSEVDRIAAVFTGTARCLWSNVNTGMMECFVRLTRDSISSLDQERQPYVELLRKRADVFISEAGRLGLPLYPYSDGFFCMLKIEDNPLLERFHSALIERHIYAIKVAGGLRIALCSMDLDECQRLPQLLSDCLKECKNG